MASSSKAADAILLEKNRLREFENERLHKRLQQLVEELALLNGTQAPQQLMLEMAGLAEQVQGLQKQVSGILRRSASSTSLRRRPAHHA